MNKENIKIEIKELNGVYEFSNFDYEIFHKSNNLEQGYKETKNKIEQRIKFFKDNNITLNNNIKNKQKFFSDLNYKNLFIKNIIRLFFSLLYFLIIVLIIFSLTNSFIKKNEIKGGREFWKNFENELQKLSNKEIDKESNEKILSSIRKIGERYKPFINEIKSIFD
jgi:hypothetical protein